MAEDSAPLPSNSSVSASAAKPYVAGPGAEPRKSGDGRGWILALACLQTASAIILFAVSADSEVEGAGITFAVMLMLGAIFFALWIWAKKALFPALLTTLIVFVTIHLLSFVVDPSSFYRGIIIKVLAVAGLGSALKKAYVAKRERELEATGS